MMPLQRCAGVALPWHSCPTSMPTHGGRPVFTQRCGTEVFKLSRSGGAPAVTSRLIAKPDWVLLGYEHSAPFLLFSHSLGLRRRCSPVNLVHVQLAAPSRCWQPHQSPLTMKQFTLKWGKFPNQTLSEQTLWKDRGKTSQMHLVQVQLFMAICCNELGSVL